MICACSSRPYAPGPGPQHEPECPAFHEDATIAAAWHLADRLDALAAELVSLHLRRCQRQLTATEDKRYVAIYQTLKGVMTKAAEETDGEPEALPCPFCGEPNDVCDLLAAQDEWVDTDCSKCKKQFQFSTDYSAYCEARVPPKE